VTEAKEGETVPEKRLSIDLSEVLYLEIFCNECKNLSILPIKDQSERFGLSLASQMCSSCQKPFAGMEGFQEMLANMREILKSHSGTQGEFSLRLVIQK
jgi:hypothetical protein